MDNHMLLLVKYDIKLEVVQKKLIELVKECYVIEQTPPDKNINVFFEKEIHEIADKYIPMH